MRVSIDLDDLGIRTWGGQAISAETGKRRDVVPVEVRFTRGGIVQELASGATGICGVKKLKSYTAGYLAAALSWVKSGSGTSTTYLFVLNLNTTEFATEFSGDPEKVAAAMEFEWVVGSYRSSSLSVPFNVFNDYIRGDETAPTASAPALAGWGNDSFRFGLTGQPEFYNPDLNVWVRMTFAGDPPQPVFTQL